MNEFSALITSEHNQRPKYMAMVEACTQTLADLITFYGGVPDDFDIDTAVGAQLDILGEWIGRSRIIAQPITGVYFTWSGTVATGWSAGSWKGAFDPSSGILSLPDESYRTLLKAKIAANHWDGTIPGAYDVWQYAFNNGSIILIQDNQDMTMVVGLAGTQLDSIAIALLTGGYIPLKPEGVAVSYYAVNPTGGPLFAWGVENEALMGWQTGSWATKLIPA